MTTFFGTKYFNLMLSNHLSIFCGRKIRQRRQAKLRALQEELRRRMHSPLKDQGAYLRSVLAGHFQYYGVPMNGRALGAFRMTVGRLW